MPQTNSLVIEGALEDQNGNAVAGQQIVARQRTDDPKSVRVVLSAVTEADGSFALELSSEDLVRLFRPLTTEPTQPRVASLSITAYSGGDVTASKEERFTFEALIQGLFVDLHIDQADDAAERRRAGHIVHGFVTQATGEPAPDMTVEVLLRTMRAEQSLATVQTNIDGSYRASLTIPNNAPPAALVVRITEGQATEIVRSEPICSYGRIVEQDLSLPLVGPTRTTYDGILDQIDPILEQVSLDSLTEDDIEHIVCLTTVSLSDAHALAAAVGLADDPDPASSLVPAFFAIGRRGVPMRAGAIAALPSTTIQQILEEAVADGVVPAWPDLPATVDQLGRTVRHQVLGTVGDPNAEEAALGQVLSLVAVDPVVQGEFLEGYINRTGTVSQFWTDFETTHTAQVGAAVRFGITVGGLTGDHRPLVTALAQRRSQGTIASAQELAAWTPARWRTELDADSVAAPDYFPGQTATERLDLYTTTLARAFEEAFPTHALIGRVTSPTRWSAAASYTAEHPTVRLGSTVMRTYVTDNPPTSGTVEDTLAELRSAQRIFALAPNFDRDQTATVLLDEGLDSAERVTRLGRTAFIDRVAPQLGDTRAAAIFDRAQLLKAAATTLLMRHAPVYNTLGTAATSQSTPATTSGGGGAPSTADLPTLFGAQDFCRCTHCRSMLSPAAYLVDVLQWVENRAGPTDPADEHPWARLLAKRPDLVEILLDCDNTNTPMPMIDLVNEILEREVASVVPDSWPQTTRTAAELRAHPEHILRAAYERLRDGAQASYPFNLPFDLPGEEARIYLRYLGVPRHALLEALATEPPPAAYERLGLSDAMASVVAGATSGADARAYWGLSAADWRTQLSQVPTFLERSGLSFEEIDELRQTQYVGAGAIEIEYAEPCILEGATLPALAGVEGAQWLDRIHRMVRLRAASGWSFSEIDAALSVLGSAGANPLDVAALTALGQVVALHESFPHIDRQELLTWFGNISTQAPTSGGRSQYEEIFVQPSGTDAQGPLELGAPDVALTTVLPQLAAALRLREDEVSALLAFTGAPTQTTLGGLSWLYRWASLSRATDLPITDALVLSEITGVEPFAALGQAAIGDVREYVRLLEHLGGSVEDFREFTWIAARRDPSGTRADGDEARVAVLVDLVRGLQTVDDQLAASVAPPLDRASVLADRLRELVGDEDTATLMAVVERIPVTPVDPLPPMPAAFDSFLGGAWAQLHAVPDANSVLAGVPARAQLVLDLLLPELLHGQLLNVAVAKLSDAYGLPVAATRELLAGPTDRLSIFADTTVVRAIDFGDEAELLGAADVHAVLAGRVGVAVVDAMRWLESVSSLTQWLGLDDGDLRWLHEYGASLGLPNLDQLPLVETVGVGAVSTSLLQLARLCRVSRPWAGGFAAARELLDASSPSRPIDMEFRQAIAVASGWEDPSVATVGSSLASVATHLLLTQDDIRAVDGLERLSRVYELAQRIGVDAARLVGWADEPGSYDETAAIARDIKAAAQAKQPPALWPSVAEPLRDVLRERQRDALVGFVVANDPSLASPEELFGRFLIDTKVSACAKTSRIKQALSAVQSFVQRVGLKLEPGVDISESSLVEWGWLKRYRVWEANRKIFLFPENWLEPELRDDKSSLFTEFEQSLQEGPLTKDSIDKAYVGYLQGLEVLGGLVPGGVAHQVEARDGDMPATNIVHVFASTKTLPRVNYYRARIDDAYWTPWSKLPFQNDWGAFVPAIFNDRLIVVWPMFQTRKPPLDRPAPEQRPGADRVEVRLQWAERQGEDWSDTRTTASGTLAQVDGRFATSQSRMFFRSQVVDDGANLVIEGSFYDGTHREYRHYHGWTMSGCNADLGSAGRPSSTRDSVYPIAVVTEPLPEQSLPSPFGTVAVRQRFTADREEYTDIQLTEAGLHMVVRPSAGSNDTELVQVFGQAPQGWSVVAPMDGASFKTESPFFYQDNWGVFFIVPTPPWAAARRVPTDPPGEFDPNHWAAQGAATTTHSMLLSEDVVAAAGPAALPSLDLPLANDTLPKRPWQFRVDRFSHPYACEMLSIVRRFSIDELLAPTSGSPGRPFWRQGASRGLADSYLPTDLVTTDLIEKIDFSFGAANSTYNWELFLHAPMYVALRLMDEKKFEEAQRWMHYIFNPTAGGPEAAPGRFWRIKPLHDTAVTPVDEQLRSLQYTGSDPEQVAVREQTVREIDQWRKNPFRPHALARLRQSAYQRWVVMKYLDNLIEWADHLFRQDTIEANNEALQLYMLATEILGPRPLELPSSTPTARTYAQVQADLDVMSNFLADVENEVVPGAIAPETFLSMRKLRRVEPRRLGSAEDGFVKRSAPQRVETPYAAGAPLPGMLVTTDEGGSLYFCVPHNSQLLRYWDIVGDRLFKLRHCLNIEGVFRQLPLFQPPIDPGALARALGGGMDLSTALGDLNAPLPHYRFRTMVSLAKELAAEVRGFGSALLDALRNRDAEGLAELRADQEVRLLQRTALVREKRVEEQTQTIEAMRESRKLAELRAAYYGSRESRSRKENTSRDLQINSSVANVIASQFDILASLLGQIPDFKGGVNGLGPEVTAAVGGSMAGRFLSAMASSQRVVSNVLQTASSLVGTDASYDRRQEQWEHEEALANQDKARIDAEIAAAEIREAIAKRELEDQAFQQEQSESVRQYLSDRYTAAELYRWMSSELSRTYFQAYQLAYDIAKQAERCYRYELGTQDASFIEFGYWDNRRKGLLAGDRLLHDLRRMEVGYLGNNRREYELTKRISLAQVDPVALVELREQGSCDFAVPEVLFELDHPGHYYRRIKDVRVTIAAVSGPYHNVSASLSLSRSEIRTTAEDYAVAGQPVVDVIGGTQTIAISHGASDAGVFEESRGDDRYLPFEGKGAVSHWHLELPTVSQYDHGTITDVVLEMRYTAREGGQALATQVLGGLVDRLAALPRPEGAVLGNASMRMWSAASDFPEAWEAFTQPVAGQPATLVLDLPQSVHPIPLEGRTVAQLAVFTASGTTGTLTVTAPSGSIGDVTLAPNATLGLSSAVATNLTATAAGTWTIASTDVDTSTLTDALIVLAYA